MSVIERIEGSERIPKEILRLAKLGEAFEKGLNNSKKIMTSAICKVLPPVISKEYCGLGCEWTELCRIRQGGAGGE